ncbi:uncharacterized protein EAF01_011113 [Botrytis porri]|uniref:uncharacterized protein n=1 Tax=Botrytis porri TaxID=87229 RepID=UPI0018FF7E6F|nr:uncharacterized protein EAF01_011113 [Botrytis porri]KAF7887959.1 hypothetical protein EAF01_011113 [Botrytis porri]
MVLLGLGLLIASVSFLYYKHAPAGWWTFLERLNLRPGGRIRDGGSNQNRDEDEKEKEGKQEDSTPRNIGVDGREDKEEKSSTLPSPPNHTINAPTRNSTAATNAPTFQISAPSQTPSIQPPSPPPSKAALDRAAMPPPPPLFKKSSTTSTPTPKTKTQPKTPSSPTTPRAHASQPPLQTPQIPSFSLDTTNSTSSSIDLESESEPEPEPEIPSFPAAHSAQRASNTGSRVPPRLNPLPAFKSTTSSLSAPSRSPLPNRNPPSRSPLPNRNPPSSSLTTPSLAPPPSHTTIPSKPRKKVLLTPNHSPLDWARLTSSPTSNLRNLPPSTPLLRVPPSLLKQFSGRKGKDAWTVLGGKVYNITPYLPYHPGGEPELLKCAGRDGTRLFGEVHPWVNWEGMLEACLVGISVGEEEFEGVGGLEDMD